MRGKVKFQLLKEMTVTVAHWWSSHTVFSQSRGLEKKQKTNGKKTPVTTLSEAVKICAKSPLGSLQKRVESKQ